MTTPESDLHVLVPVIDGMPQSEITAYVDATVTKACREAGRRVSGPVVMIGKESAAAHGYSATHATEVYHYVIPTALDS